MKTTIPSIVGYAIQRGSLLKYARDQILYSHLDQNWVQRVKLATACPDNHKIPRIPTAGCLKEGRLVMHNGVMVGKDSYYGNGIAKLIQANTGVHEPQEEFVFQEVLKYVPESATMIELGAYWGFYSLWFLQEIHNSRAFLIEPESANLDAGKSNFAINRLGADFTLAYVGQESSSDGRTRTVCMDDFILEKKLDKVTILHSDIQGHEAKMLRGSARSFRDRIIDYVFISTHGLKVHLECLQFLKENRFLIIANADKYESYSLDGLIVARREEMSGCPAIAISHR
jgi:hypothetical protein